jgi:two-component system, LytTR family, response regulator
VIHALIVDDEPPARAQVAEFLMSEPDVRVIGESGDGEGALRQIRSLQPDLLFMDVRMPRMSGLDVLRSNAKTPMPYTIFTTAYSDYAVEAFAVEALDYLVKPLERRRFRDAVDRARRYLARDASLVRRLHPDLLAAFLARIEAIGDRGRTEHLPIRLGRRIQLLDPALIEYVRADGDYAVIYQGDGETLRTRESVTALEAGLPSHRFIRIHRSTIVNLDRIRELRSNKRGSYTLLTVGGRQLAVGATYCAALRTLLRR